MGKLRFPYRERKFINKKAVDIHSFLSILWLAATIISELVIIITAAAKQ